MSTTATDDQATEMARALARRRWDNAPTMERTCARCGTAFTTAQPIRLYCGHLCQNAAGVARHRARQRQAHPTT